ncbi:olfactory receptor 10A7-like [Tachyglossus aculeatus]|uniref:olfactory receptor 10A7-like n=1 Tax=Tachyglossus aculeatus TaxID=9261 RepID=UPI0018F774F7|nr:olfactory receptor 10A7-like [Tachyglossus aculeatus]
MSIGYSTAIIPQRLTNFLSKNQNIPFGGCAAHMYFAFCFGPSACLILAMLVYDRHAAICTLLYFSLVMSWRLCLQLALASWLSRIPMATIQTAMMFTLPFCGHNLTYHFFCDNPLFLELVCTDSFMIEVYSVTMIVIILMLPFEIIAYYNRIFITILKMSSTEGRHKAFSTCSSHFIVISLFFGAYGEWIRHGKLQEFLGAEG